jgi:hypothetical protein
MPDLKSSETTFRSGSFSQELQEMSMFFEGRGQVNKSLRRLVKRLEKAKIPYAIVGAMALAAHHYQRATTDLDILLTAQGFAEFQKRFVPAIYDRVPGRKRRVVDRVNGIHIDVLVTGLFPGSGQPGPIAYPDPEGVAQVVEGNRVVDLVTLIQLKLAARRYKDFGDVVELIRSNNLDESFEKGLHPTLRQDYIECLEEKRREDEYEAREG